MYHIVWGAVIGLVISLIVLFGFGIRWKKYLFVGMFAVAMVVIGGLLGLARHKSVCANPTVETKTTSQDLRDLQTGFYSDSDASILEKISTSNLGENAYLYWPDNNLSKMTVLDSQYDVTIVDDGRTEVEIIEFSPSSHCENSDELVIPKDKYIFHVPLARLVIVDGK